MSAGPATARTPAAAHVTGVEAGGVPGEDLELGVARGDRQHDLEQEAVELGLGQRVGAFVLDRVLGGRHQERAGQLSGDPVDRDLPLLHRLQQRRLRLGGRPVDLVGQQQVGEQRALAEASSPARPSITIEPVMSPGIRSGVNCTRRVSTSSEPARVRTSSVFATPARPPSARGRRTAARRAGRRRRRPGPRPPWRPRRGRRRAARGRPRGRRGLSVVLVMCGVPLCRARPTRRPGG